MRNYFRSKVEKVKDGARFRSEPPKSRDFGKSREEWQRSKDADRAQRMAAAERRERRVATDPREAQEKAHRPAWSRYGRWEAKEQRWLDKQRARETRKADRGRGGR